MPKNNRFRHQSYPTAPAIPPRFHKLDVADGTNVEFDRLHTELGFGNVVLVHGTFMGDDPFGVSETLRTVADNIPLLRKPLESVAAKLQDHTKPFTDTLTGDIGNYNAAFRDQFQKLVGDDPQVHLMAPTWSGQNHHLARADLAVRLVCQLADFSPEEHQRVLLWGHSHAGNGFAVLSNLLANEPKSTAAFFDASAFQAEPHWVKARSILAAQPAPVSWARWICIAAFGTPVRYGWDRNGYEELIHVLHHRNYDAKKPEMAHPMFPPHSFGDMTSAKFGDWVQAFGIAGTDIPPPTLASAHVAMGMILEAGLDEPDHGLDTKFIPTDRVRNACARWKTGTRCHADGHNLLVKYQPSGRIARLILPVEDVLLGHGVATTIDWLPSHLALVMQQLSKSPTRHSEFR